MPKNCQLVKESEKENKWYNALLNSCHVKCVDQSLSGNCWSARSCNAGDAEQHNITLLMILYVYNVV